MEKGIIVSKNLVRVDLRNNSKFYTTSYLNNLFKKTSLKTGKTLEIFLNIYPLKKLKDTEFEIQDHINLSGLNPLTGPIFIPLNNAYKTSNKKNTIVVANLQQGVKPNKLEAKKLIEIGCLAYCYGLADIVITAAHNGFKIKAHGTTKKII